MSPHLQRNHGCLSLFLHCSYIPSCNYCGLFWRKEDRSCRYPMLLALPSDVMRSQGELLPTRQLVYVWCFICVLNSGTFTRWGCQPNAKPPITWRAGVFSVGVPSLSHKCRLLRCWNLTFHHFHSAAATLLHYQGYDKDVWNLICLQSL